MKYVLFLKSIKKKKRTILNKRGEHMKFIKGVMIGGLITTGLVMMYTETDIMNKKKMMKKGKQMVKKLGIM